MLYFMKLRAQLILPMCHYYTYVHSSHNAPVARTTLSTTIFCVFAYTFHKCKNHVTKDPYYSKLPTPYLFYRILSCTSADLRPVCRTNRVQRFRLSTYPDSRIIPRHLNRPMSRDRNDRLIWGAGLKQLRNDLIAEVARLQPLQAGLFAHRFKSRAQEIRRRRPGHVIAPAFHAERKQVMVRMPRAQLLCPLQDSPHLFLRDSIQRHNARPKFIFHLAIRDVDRRRH